MSLREEIEALRVAAEARVHDENRDRESASFHKGKAMGLQMALTVIAHHPEEPLRAAARNLIDKASELVFAGKWSWIPGSHPLVDDLNALSAALAASPAAPLLAEAQEMPGPTRCTCERILRVGQSCPLHGTQLPPDPAPPAEGVPGPTCAMCGGIGEIAIERDGLATAISAPCPRCTPPAEGKPRRWTCDACALPGLTLRSLAGRCPVCDGPVREVTDG